MSTHTDDPPEWSPFEGAKLTAYALEPNGMGEGSVNTALAKAYDACDTAMEERDALREELKALRVAMCLYTIRSNVIDEAERKLGRKLTEF